MEVTDSQSQARGLSEASSAFTDNGLHGNSPGRAVRGNQQAQSRSIPEFSELVLACRHHFVLTLTLALTFAGVLVVTAWQYTEAHYAAESLLQVRQHQDVVFTSQTSRADDAAFVRAQEQVVVSPQVLTAALQDEQLQVYSHLIPTHDATAWLKSLLLADVQSGAEVMSISARHPIPEFAQALSNAVANAYLVENDNRVNSDRNRRQAELEKAALAADRQLDSLWAQLNEVASQVGSDSSQSLTMRDEMQLQSYREYAQQMRAAQIRATELQTQLSAAELQLAKADVAAEVSGDRFHDSPRMVMLREHISRLDGQLRQMREIAASDEAPRIVRLKEERDHYQSELEQTTVAMESQAREQSRAAIKSNLQSNVDQLQKQIELNRTETEFLRGRMAELDAKVVRTDKKNGVQLEISRHAVDRQTRLADSLWQALEEFRIESQSKPRVTLLQSADLPVQANHSRQIKVAGSAGVLGAMCAVLGIGYREWKGCHVRDSNDVILHSSRPVFGTSCLASRHNSTSQKFNNGSSELAARMMLPAHTGDSVPSLMVSSALDNEPRHMVAIDLAFGFRNLRRRTLLIDCDTSGELTRQLGAEDAPGIIQFDRDLQQLKSSILKSNDKGLDILPLGCGADVEPWIDPENFRDLLTLLKAEYQAIVVNGPSMASPVESLLIASEAGQLVFAVFGGISRWDKLAEAEELALDSGITVLGSILHSQKPVNHLELQTDQSAAPLQSGSEQSDLEIQPEQNDLETQAEQSMQADLSAIRQQIDQAASPQLNANSSPVCSKEST